MALSQLQVDISTQQLCYLKEGKLVKIYSISTGLKGTGEKQGSGQTPRGWHIVRAKVGASCPVNTVFVSRRPTGEIYSSFLSSQFPNRDWILTRILWLSGLEVGKNRLGDCDTMRRYIYIHGCPDSAPLGTPLSAGCIRMRNDDIVELFEHVYVGTTVFIQE